MNLDQLIRTALAEDLTDGRDVTTDLFVGPDVSGAGWIEARQDAVASGLDVARAVFLAVDGELRVENLIRDGARVKPLERVMTVSGCASAILRAERTALNFLCHLSGIATVTRRLVEATRRWGTKILCTRKTTPGLRDLEVTAVRHGGGDAFRTNLSDAVLLKDNHLAILGGMVGAKLRLESLRRTDPQGVENLLTEGKIEVASEEDAAAAVEMGWRYLLLDNLSPIEVARIAQRWGPSVYLEVSGGVTEDNVAQFAAAGVHAISVGALTHSSKAADFSLEVEWRRS